MDHEIEHGSRRIRWLAVSLLLVPGLIRLLSGNPLRIQAVSFDWGMALSILLLAPVPGEEGRLSLVLALSVWGLSVMAAILWPRLVVMRGLLSFVFCTLLTVPRCILEIVRMSALLRHKVPPPGKATLWPLIQALIQDLYVILLLSLILPALLGAALSGQEGKSPWAFVCLGILVCFFVHLFVRSLVAGQRPSGGLTPAGGLAAGPAGRDGLKDAASRDLYDRMCAFFEESKPYLSDRFRIEDLARALYSNKAYVSRVINDGTGLNYQQLKNYYRIRYAMEEFKKNPKLKVSELSDLSGFHSTVSFNMAFNLFMNRNPSEWCRDYRDSLRSRKGDREPLSRSAGGEPSG